MTTDTTSMSRVTALDIAVTELARLRDASNVRPDGIWQVAHGVRSTVPYPVWRKAEGRYLRLDAWAKMVATVPDGGIRHHGRTWNWTSYLNGGRTQLRNSDWSSLVMLDGEVPPIGDRPAVPVDGIGHRPRIVLRGPGSYAPAPPVRDPVPSPMVRVTFPDWATVTPCALGCYPSRDMPTVRAVNPMASVYAARIAHGMPSNPYRGMC